MARLDQDKQKKLEPKRIAYARAELEKIGIQIADTTKTSIRFYWKGKSIMFYPYSGWHTGKTITDGRGIEKLLIQLKSESHGEEKNNTEKESLTQESEHS